MKRCSRLAVVLSLFASQAAMAWEGKVLVDQVGYDTGAVKQAIVAGEVASPARDFRVVNTDTGKVVLQGTLSGVGKVAHWGDAYAIADFSSVRTPGHYY